MKTDYTKLDNTRLVEHLCYAADDGAMYHLIFNRLYNELLKTMAQYDITDPDARYDTLMDFFFYLRDGEKGDNPMPYAALMLIRDPEKLDGWMWRYFRYFLAAKHRKDKKGEELTAHDLDTDDDAHIFTTDEIDTAIRLLELVNRSFSAVERYIFFTDLYALKQDKTAVESNIMASLLGCTPGNLRVMRHRLKNKIRQLLNQSNR